MKAKRPANSNRRVATLILGLALAAIVSGCGPSVRRTSTGWGATSGWTTTTSVPTTALSVEQRTSARLAVCLQTTGLPDTLAKATETLTAIGQFVARWAPNDATDADHAGPLEVQVRPIVEGSSFAAAS